MCVLGVSLEVLLSTLPKSGGDQSHCFPDVFLGFRDSWLEWTGMIHPMSLLTPSLSCRRERLQSRSNSNTKKKAQDKIRKCFAFQCSTWVSESPLYYAPLSSCPSLQMFFKSFESCDSWSLKLSLKSVKHWLPSQHALRFFLAWARPTQILPSAASSLPQGPPVTITFPGMHPTDSTLLDPLCTTLQCTHVYAGSNFLEQQMKNSSTCCCIDLLEKTVVYIGSTINKLLKFHAQCYSGIPEIFL